MFRTALIPLALIAASSVAAPVTFPPSGDSGKGTVVANGDSVEFIKPDAYSIKADFGEAITLENEGDSVVFTGEFELEGNQEQSLGNFRFGLIAAPTEGHSGCLGYFVMAPADTETGYMKKREGGSHDKGNYLSYLSTTPLPLKNTGGTILKASVLPKRFTFNLRLTRTKEGLDCQVGWLDGETVLLALTGADTRPKTFRFESAAFFISSKNSDKVTLRHVDVTLHKAGLGGPVIITILAIAALLAAGATTVVVMRRRRAAVPLTAPRPPAPPAYLPPPPGAR